MQRYSAFFEKHPLTRANPLAAWMRMLSWQIKSRLADEVIVEWVGPLRLAVRSGMTGATGNIYVGLHEFTDMALVMHYARPKDVLFDVGANIGTYSLLAAGIGGAQVDAFEPDGATAQSLRRNVEVNHLSSRITIHEHAVGAEPGVTTFTKGLDATNRIPDEGYEGPVQSVSIRTLDEIAAKRGPTILKIDVEGHEDAVLEGARKTVQATSLQIVIIESVSDRAAELLAREGFKPCIYDPFTRRLEGLGSRTFPYNNVYVRDIDAVAARLQAAAPVPVLGQRI